jgi:hypothetical protein
MNERISGYLLVLLSLVVALVGIFVVLTSVVMADNGSTTGKTLNRDLEPVIITGTAFSALAGFPIDELFIYTYQGGVWEQIPAQVDEVTATGAYTTTEDGLLDANDEIVFMAMDLGDQAVGMVPTANGQPIGALWYEIEVTDPISPTRKGWAYLVHSNVLTPTFTADYVSFDPIQLHINGINYHLGFAASRPWLEYLSFGDSEIDILDRTPKLRLCLGEVCWFTEDNTPDVEDDVIRDGPVRAILRSGRARAYGTMATWTVPVPLILFANRVRFSTDFSSAASGATFYNAVVPDGVTVDGIPDDVPASPPSSWAQLNTSTGTIIQVADNSPIGGNQTNYYLDDATIDTTDTGDMKHYADTGISATNPNRSFTYTFAFYFLAESQPNIGAVYEAYFMQPLLVAASREGFSVTLAAAPESLAVDGSSTLTATVEYASDPISGTIVAFTIVSGQGVLTPTIATTDAAGKATASLSSQVAGRVVVKAATDSVDSNTKTITFTPGAVTTVTLEAVPERLITGRSSTLTATVVDQYSNPIGDTDVTFALVSGSGVITPTIAKTNESGKTMASLSSQVAGSVVVKAVADSIESNSRTITFVEGRCVYLPVVMKNATTSSTSRP